jgi:PIN domain nuclease of toxin-antitoxin system
MILLADTVALIWHLRRHRKLSQRARRLLEEADAARHTVYISVITLMEMLHVIEQRELNVHLDELIDRINALPGYVILPVDEEVVRIASDVDDVPELHDRMLVATAKLYEVPILTSDPVISKSRSATVIW